MTDLIAKLRLRCDSKTPELDFWQRLRIGLLGAVLIYFLSRAIWAM